MRNSRVVVVAICALLTAALAPAQQRKSGTGDPAKGKEVFSDQCAVCHNPDSDLKKSGPGLKDFFKKAKLKNGKPLTEQSVRAGIESGGGGMPAYREMLSTQEKDHLIAYLKTL